MGMPVMLETKREACALINDIYDLRLRVRMRRDARDVLRLRARAGHQREAHRDGHLVDDDQPRAVGELVECDRHRALD